MPSSWQQNCLRPLTPPRRVLQQRQLLPRWQRLRLQPRPHDWLPQGTRSHHEESVGHESDKWPELQKTRWSNSNQKKSKQTKPHTSNLCLTFQCRVLKMKPMIRFQGPPANPPGHKLQGRVAHPPTKLGGERPRPMLVRSNNNLKRPKRSKEFWKNKNGQWVVEIEWRIATSFSLKSS